MLLLNTQNEHGAPLVATDAETLGIEAAAIVERFLEQREGHEPTPLVFLPALASRLGIAGIHVKDEGHRLGLGSFKALGGSYAVIRLVLAEASKHLGRDVGISELHGEEVRAIASTMTVACATDGNHGRSVAMGARLVGARCSIFVHSGVSEGRIAAIARYGADMIRVEGNYDDSVREAQRVAAREGWITVSDTSWPGYERIPAFVMQGYTALLTEALRQMPERPTHVFVQAGVGGIAATTAGHFSVLFGDDRPFFTVVDPSKAACLFESAKVGHPVAVPHGEATVMAMLECYEPSLIAWRILARAADAFMTVDDQEAIDAMRLLAYPEHSDPAIVAGESGGVGLAALLNVAADPALREAIGLDESSRVFLINTEGATDPELYESLVGKMPEAVAARNRVDMATSSEGAL